MHVLVTNFDGISNIGLYAFVNDKYLLLGREVPEVFDKDLEKVFKVPVHRITIAGTSLIGAFVAGNNEKILIPGITFREEIQKLKDLGVKFEVFNTRLTGLGNNIILGEDNAIINPEFSDAEAKKIEELMGVKTLRLRLANMFAVGGLVALNRKRKKALVSNDLSLEELRVIEKTFSVNATPGSVNMGSRYITAGLLVNGNGFAIGEISGGPELSNADEALGFLGDE